MAAALSGRVLADVAPTATVCDPTVGHGAFLLAAADRLLAAGGDPSQIVREQLFGADLDPSAVDATVAALGSWARQHGGQRVTPMPGHLVCADALTGGEIWPDRPGRGFAFVLGNPPFGSQLRRRTARARARADGLLARFGIGALGYVDDAALFLLESCDLVAPDGTVCLILPLSLATARDAASVRVAVDARMVWDGLWVGGDVGFDAAVQVWAPVLRRSRTASPTTTRWLGPAASPAPAIRRAAGSASWAPRYADLLGGPDLDVDAVQCGEGRIGDRATVTAGFRQHFYALAPHVRARHGDEPGRARPALLTSGAIDPLHDRWATRISRFAGLDLLGPVIDLTAVRHADPTIARWVEDRLVPKVLVAPQGKVIEAIVDRDGLLVPSTPVISVEPGASRPAPIGLDHLTALLTSPVAAAIVHRDAAGSGLGAGSFRLTARRVAALPFPADADQWDRGADAARRATEAGAAGDVEAWRSALHAVATAMNAAFGLAEDHPVLWWWESLLPTTLR